MDDASRLQIERTAAHPNGVQRVAGVSLVVHDLEAAHHLYGEQIGLAAAVGHNALGQTVHYAVGDFTIALLTAADDGGARTFLEAHGEGLYQVIVGASDLEAVATLWAAGGVLAEAETPVRTAPSQTLGAQLVVVPV
jgi:4-hydroxyphenylpyruvate dioxygenase-like putative hemolysin